MNAENPKQGFQIKRSPALVLCAMVTALGVTLAKLIPPFCGRRWKETRGGDAPRSLVVVVVL